MDCTTCVHSWREHGRLECEISDENDCPFNIPEEEEVLYCKYYQEEKDDD